MACGVHGGSGRSLVQEVRERTAARIARHLTTQLMNDSCQRHTANPTVAQVLAAAEEQEAKLVTADEQLARRRTDMEREHAARMAEAESAVRRLRAECEHQLAIERARSAEVVRQKGLVEERLGAAEGRVVELERAFAEYR